VRPFAITVDAFYVEHGSHAGERPSVDALLEHLHTLCYVRFERERDDVRMTGVTDDDSEEYVTPTYVLCTSHDRRGEESGCGRGRFTKISYLPSTCVARTALSVLWRKWRSRAG